jgi:hypothetical protein
MQDDCSGLAGDRPLNRRARDAATIMARIARRKRFFAFDALIEGVLRLAPLSIVSSKETGSPMPDCVSLPRGRCARCFRRLRGSLIITSLSSATTLCARMTESILRFFDYQSIVIDLTVVDGV